MRGRVLRATEVPSDFVDPDPRHRVAVADIDGDGRLDAAVSKSESGTIDILLSNGDGTSRSYRQQLDFPAIALLDLNGDDKLDLIAVDHESIVVRAGNGDGTFGEARIADSCGRFVAPVAISGADFNRDGWIDLVIADVRPNRLVMLMGSSDGTFRSSVEYRLIVTPASLAVDDFDADGWPDVAFANENDRAFGVLLRSELANHDCPTASQQDRARLPITVNATQTIFIGFDQDAAGSDIPNLSLIDEQYAALGVHFNATFYAARRALAFPSYSANFSLNYLCTFFGTAGGDRPCIEPIGGGAAVLVADIDFPIEFASIEGYTRNDGEFDRDGLIIDAYGAGGNLLAEGSDFQSNDPPPHTREGILRAAVGASGIRRLVIDPIDTDALDSLTLRFNSNNPPVANSQSVTTPEDTPKNMTLTGSDPDGNPLTFIIVTGPAHGMLSAGAPNVTYTPSSNYNGPDSFTFKVNDGSADSNAATVSINVTPVNDPPVANSQSVTTPEDTPRSITLTGSDVDGDSLSFAIVTGPAHGTLSGSGATVTYTPNANYNGPDSFTFKVNDGKVDSNVATVSINVTPVNDPPVANSQSVTTPEDTPIGITLTGSDVDGDALSFMIVTGPAHGTLSAISGGSLTYTPNTDYNGPDSFTFKVNDGSADSNVATVSITVTPLNDPPVANSQSVATPEDTAIAITLTGSDVDGDALSFAIVTGPAHGTLSGSGTNVTYTPNANYNGPDNFTFKVNDGTVDSNGATVSIDVTPVNDAPTASSQSVTTPEDTPEPITLTGSDVDGDSLTFTIVTGPAHGTLSGSGANITYTPNTNYNGPDSFTFKINDGTVDSNVATVSIDVTPVNDAPVANPQSVITPEDTPIAITLTASDVDGDPLTFAIVTGPAHGTLSSSGANVTYMPSANYNGPDSFTFKVNDGMVDSNIATVSITVTPVNDPPVANSQTVSACASSSTPIVLTGSDPVEGSPVVFIIVTPPLHGTLGGSAPNIVYTPTTFATGDSFTFKVNDGESDSNIATVTLVDQTPPTISCPADITVGSKCGAAGSVVGYPAPIAGDFCSLTVAVSCSNPSGSPFPNGMTTVTCTALDLSGNSSSCSFHVTVRTPQIAIQALIDRVIAILGAQDANSFVAKLDAALKSLEKDCHLTPAINQLEAFIREVEGQRGKKLTDAQADELIAAAQQIIAQLLQP